MPSTRGWPLVPLFSWHLTDCLRIVYRCTRQHSLHPPPWPGPGLATRSLFQLNLSPFALDWLTLLSGKRILIQKQCLLCNGSGLIERGRYKRKCTSCGGFLPWESWGQGLKLVHFSAQLEPGLTQENTLHTPLTRATQPLRAPPIPYKALKLS